jgi:hypothetical protein
MGGWRCGKGVRQMRFEDCSSSPSSGLSPQRARATIGTVMSFLARGAKFIHSIVFLMPLSRNALREPSCFVWIDVNSAST